MKKLCFTFVVAIFLNIENYSFSQIGNDSLLLSLRKELFPFQDDTTIIKISAFCKIDESENDFYTYSKQPDFISVTNVLKKIAFSKDVSLIPGLDRIKHDYIVYLAKGWDSLFAEKYNCKLAHENLQIFQCIEETLLSLNFTKKNLNKLQRFNFYLDVQRRWYKSVFDNNNGYRAFEDFKEYSPYYLNLMRNRIAGAPVLSFDFIEPHFKDLEDLLIEYFEDYYTSSLKAQKLEFEGYVFFRVLNTIDEEKNYELLSNFINILLTNKYIDKIEISRNVIAILRNSKPNGLLENKIIERLNESNGIDKMNVLLASSYIFTSEFADVLIEFEKSGKLTKEENQYLHKVLAVISSRPYITEEQKVQLKKILKNNR